MFGIKKKIYKAMEDHMERMDYKNANAAIDDIIEEFEEGGTFENLTHGIRWWEKARDDKIDGFDTPPRRWR